MKVLAAIVAAIALGACAGPGPTPAASATPGPAAPWRLVAAADRDARWAYSVHAATSAAEWSALWAELSPGLEEPSIDLATEIAAVFADGTGGPGNCSERRLDGVVIDVENGLVFSRISDPLGPRACDAMLGGSSIFVVALARAALPASPFVLRLGEEQRCADCPEQITVDLR